MSESRANNIGPKFDRDRFFVNQRRLSLKEKYYVYDEHGTGLFYVERPFQWWGRRDIIIYEDDSKRAPVVFITQDHLWEIFQRNYTVADVDRQVLARLSRNNFKSLFRRAWNIVQTNEATLMTAREDSVLLAAIRRIVDLIPYVALLGGMIKTDFHLLTVDSAGDERKIGEFTRRISVFDKYVLDLSEDSERQLDRRVALAVGILLDTAEKR